MTSYLPVSALAKAVREAVSVGIHVLRCRRVDRYSLHLGTSGHPRPGSPPSTCSDSQSSTGE